MNICLILGGEYDYFRENTLVTLEHCLCLVVFVLPYQFPRLMLASHHRLFFLANSDIRAIVPFIVPTSYLPLRRPPNHPVKTPPMDSFLSSKP